MVIFDVVVKRTVFATFPKCIYGCLIQILAYLSYLFTQVIFENVVVVVFLGAKNLMFQFILESNQKSFSSTSLSQNLLRPQSSL